MRISILNLKLFSVVLFTSLLILFVGYQLGHRTGLFIGLMVAVCWISLLWISDEESWLEFFSLKRLQGQDSWGLLTKVEFCARRLHMNPPDLFLVNSRSSFLLSLSLGLPREAILISRPVLEHFTDEEIEALIASELTSLWLRRRFRFRWFHLQARSWIKLAELMDRSIPIMGPKAGVFARLMTPFSQSFLKLSFWGRFENERDEMTISLLQDRRPLASAMWKLTSLAQVHPLKIPPGSEHLFLVSPFRKEEEGHFLRFHSPIQNRMRRILGADSV